jgi:hypothetical protein
MKLKGYIIPLLYLVISSLLISVIAAGGDVSDPLVSLSYLNGTYTSSLDAKITEKLDASDAALQSATGGIATPSAPVASAADTWAESRLKSGDVLSGSTGLNVTLLAGSATVAFSSGAVIDVTAGTAIGSGAALTANHRYMVAEDTTASFSVTSKTAVIDYMGYYSIAPSAAVDYNAMAAALNTMHLFRGSFTGYGSGYDLEVAPTRLQALIMFIRVLGEENAALSYTGSVPYTDVAAGSDAAKYVGYACSMGYTNGYTATLWKPAQPVNAYQYTEFMLRALGYSSTANTDLSGTLERAVSSGVLTGGEIAALKSAKFLRADLVYVSYYAMNAVVSDGSGTLRDALIGKGVFTAAESASAQASVSSTRIA